LSKCEEDNESYNFPTKHSNHIRYKQHELSPINAITAFNAVLAAAQQSQNNIYSNTQKHEHLVANSKVEGSELIPLSILPGTSKNLMQIKSSMSPTAAIAYQRSYLEAFRLYKAAYGTTSYNSVNSAN